jgi:hypothetical protein
MSGGKMAKRTIIIDTDRMEQALQRALREQYQQDMGNSDTSYSTIPERAKWWTGAILNLLDETNKTA